MTRYALPSAALVNRYNLETRPHHLAVNCNTTLLSVVDVTGLLQFVDLGKPVLNNAKYFWDNLYYMYYNQFQMEQEEVMKEIFSSLRGRMCGT